MSNSKWIGPCVRHTEGRALYKSCEIESGQVVCIGDYVYMLPQDPSVGPFIARIESLFEDDEAQCVQVRWLFRQTDLKHNPPSVPRENEVFYTNYFDCQLIQSIKGLCNVVTDFSSEPLGREIEGNSTNVHICRFCYSEESGEFVAVLPEDINEDTITEMKDMAHMLVQIEKRMPPETSTALWKVKRVAWMDNLKAVINLEELKEALLELEDGYCVFPNQSSWQESIGAIESSDTLLQYIKSFSYEMRLKAGAFNDAKRAANSLNRLRISNSYRKKHKRKRGPPVLISSLNVEKQVSEDSFICQSLYKIDQRSLPEDAPQQLKNLRAALVNNTTKESVIIIYPSMASLTEYFEEVNASTDEVSEERKVTKCLFNQVSSSICAMPRFDEEFSMTLAIAQRVLKGLVTLPEYLQQGHLESFWLKPGLHTTCRNTETQADEHEKSWEAKEIAISSPNQDTIKKHRPSEDNSLQVYTHKKCYKEKMQTLSKNEKLSESEFSGEQSEHDHNSTGTREMPASSEDPDCKDAPTLQHTVDSKPGYQFTEDCKERLQNHDASEQNEGIIRWGIRKKTTMRCRSNIFSDISIGKGLYCNKDVHKQDQHRVQKRSHGSNARNQVVATKITTRIGKGKMLKVPKLMEGRWSTERYKAAQLKLFEIMREKGAVPGKPLLRPALRIEARKHIGDTGLLDHLLKHMTDTVIDDGERFRRRHNSEGAMEYWLEDARLQELRRQAGVDQYWIPPAGWKIGDIITDTRNEGMSSSQLAELKQLREEVENLKSQLRYVCLHVGVNLVRTSNLRPNFEIQSWKKIGKSTTKAQERAEELQEFREVFECHDQYMQRSSVIKNSRAERDIVTCSRTTPIEYDCLKKPNNDNKHKLIAQDASPTGISQADAVADTCETIEKVKMGSEQADDQTGSKSGDEITFFFKAARRRSLEKTNEVIAKVKQVNSERKSTESIMLRRSPRSATRKVSDDKENVVPITQKCEPMKAFQGWKKTQDSSQREVLSAKSANVTSSLCKSPTPS